MLSSFVGKFLLLSLLSLALSPVTAAAATTVTSPEQPLLTALEAPKPVLQIAILGDRHSTGAHTHPDLLFDFGSFWDLLEGRLPRRPFTHPEAMPLAQSFYTGPTVEIPLLAPSPKEIGSSFELFLKHGYRQFTRYFLDIPEFSFLYWISRKLGASATSITVAAEDNARMVDLLAQMDSVLMSRQGFLPDKMFIFFGGNDICHGGLKGMSSAKEYGSALRMALEYAIRNGQLAHGASMELVVLAPLSLTQLLTKESLLNKEILFQGQASTCRNFFKQSLSGDWVRAESLKNLSNEAIVLSRLLPQSPAQLCPNLFALEQQVRTEQGFNFFLAAQRREEKLKVAFEHRLGELSMRLREYKLEGAKVVREVQAWREKKFIHKDIQLRYIGETFDFSIEPEYLGSDCFHLNLKGQKALAEQFLRIQ